VQSVSTFQSRFFWKLYASYVLIVFGTTAVVWLLVQHQMARALLSDVTTSLRDKTLLTEPYAAPLFTSGVSEDLERNIKRIGKRTSVRITLIAPDGTVLADSERNPAEMDNHGDRPEVLGALLEPFGISRRFSRTLDQDMLYVAHTLRAHGTVVGTIRTSMPLEVIDGRLGLMQANIAAGAGFGLLVALILGLIVARRVTAPIAEMTAVAAAMRDGQYDARVRSSPPDEIGILGDTLNRLGTEVTYRIATISHDQAELQAMIAGMVEGVIAVDEQDCILHCNEAARTLLGIETHSVAGRHFWEIVRLPALVDMLSEARSRREPIRRETVVHPGPGEVVLEAHATAFTTQEGGGLVMVLHDISDLRKLERIRRDFVANVSHELKTPLTSVKGYVETLLNGALHDQQHNVRFLEKIDAHVARLDDLVHDLLNLASIEAREGTLTTAPIDWQPIVEGSIRRHEEAFERKSLTCIVEGDCPTVLGEPEGMTQVIDNLLDNAIKYTPEGGVIRVRLSGSTDVAHLEVQDSGIGIPEEDRERIFERFYRVDKARSRELGGTGLGLSIVKHFVLAMNGDIRVESHVNRGSQFIVALPLATSLSSPVSIH
jgi:two-component system phosphate regulon sensor histidine kinase PhoR